MRIIAISECHGITRVIWKLEHGQRGFKRIEILAKPSLPGRWGLISVCSLFPERSSRSVCIMYSSFILFLVQKNKLIMKTLTLTIPDTVDEKEVKMQLAAHLFEKGILSSGQAADLVGITKREFLENVGKYGVSIFGEGADDIEKIISG